MPRTQVTHEEIVEAGVFSAISGIYKVMPGIVQTYYPAQPGVQPASVDVAPAVNDVRIDTSTGERVSETCAVLPKVPVAWLRFGSFVVAGPLAAGSKVLLVSPDLDPTIHRATGNVEDPPMASRHKGSQWVAFPVDITDGGALADPGQALVLGAPGGVEVAITATAVNLGSATPSDAVALAGLVLAELHKIQNALGSLTVTSGVGAGGTVIAAIPYFSPPTVASQTVKCAP